MKLLVLKYLLREELNKVPRDDKRRFIVTAYNRVARALSDNYTNDEVVTAAKIRRLDITDHMKEKLLDLSKRKLSKQNKKDLLKIELDELLGIGEAGAAKLVNAGLEKLSDLRKPEWRARLNEDTLTALDHMPTTKIPYETIKKLRPMLVGIKTRGISAEIVGGFRRKKPYSKDIDVLVCSRSEAAIETYLAYVETKFPVHVYSQGPDKASFIITHKRKNYHVDAFRAALDEYHSHLLYSTGSKEFNIRMRGTARRLGYKLNQRGLFKGERRVNAAGDTERDFFRLLGMKYVAPEDRT